MSHYLLILPMTVTGAFGAFFLKRASAADGIAALLKNRNFYLGGVLYVLAALMNIYLLRFLPYNIVLPLTSVTYIWTALIGWKLLGEAISIRSGVGIACVALGVIVLVTAQTP